MTLQEFKSLHKIATLSFYRSKASQRLVAGLPSISSSATIVSTVDFDATLPAFVYDNPEGTVGESFVISNKAPKEAVVTL